MRRSPAPRRAVWAAISIILNFAVRGFHLIIDVASQRAVATAEHLEHAHIRGRIRAGIRQFASSAIFDVLSVGSCLDQSFDDLGRTRECSDAKRSRMVRLQPFSRSRVSTSTRKQSANPFQTLIRCGRHQWSRALLVLHIRVGPGRKSEQR